MKGIPKPCSRLGVGYRCEIGDRTNIEVERVEHEVIIGNRNARVCVYFPMNSNRVFEAAIRALKNLLWQNLLPTHNLPDTAMVMRIHELAIGPNGEDRMAFMREAVERGH